MRFRLALACFCLLCASQATAQTTVLPSLRIIDTSSNVGAHASVSVDANGRLATSYYDSLNGDLLVWIDDGRGGGTAEDRLPNGTEIRSIDTAGNVGRYTSITTDADGRLAVSYADITNNALKLWLDDGRGGGTAGDGVANGSEIRVIEAGTAGISTSITTDTNGHLAISYEASTSTDLKVWIDDGRGGGIAGDGLANGTEIRAIDTAGNVGLYPSITTDANGRLAVSYADDTNFNLKLWLDDGAGGGTAGDGIPNGSELRVLDSVGDVGYFTSIIKDTNDHLAVSYRDVTNQDLKVWIDDGSGGGTAGDGLANGTELRTIDSTGDVGSYTSVAVDEDSHLSVSYYDSTNGALKLWTDNGAGGGTPDDGIANGTEVDTIDDSADAGMYSSLTVDGHGRLAAAYFDLSNQQLKLAYFERYNPRNIETTGSSGQYTSITLDANGRLAVSFFNTSLTAVQLWVDDGNGGGIAGNGIRDGTETRTIDSPGNVGQYTSIIKDGNNRLAVSYLNTTAASLKLWVDDGTGGGTAGDEIVNGSELRTIDSGSVGSYSSITADQNGRLAVSYAASSSGNLMLWWDDGAGGGTAGDGIANGSEIRTIDSGGGGVVETSIAVDTNGHLAISYYTLGDVLLWLDDGNGGGTPDDGIQNGSEIRTIAVASSGSEGTSVRLNSAGRLAIAFHDTGAQALELWVDDGLGGGTAGDGLSNGGEVRVIEASQAGEDPALAVDASGRLAISYHVSSTDDLHLWVDDGAGGGIAGDEAANGSEIRALDTTGSTGSFSSIVSDRAGRLAVSYNYQSLNDLKLVAFVPSGSANLVGNGSGIGNGDTIPTSVNDTDFGSQSVASGIVTKTYTMQNVGESDLYLGTGAVAISGTNAADFTVNAQPSRKVGPSDETTFDITFNPSASGARTATVTVRNNDAANSPYTFAIGGLGLAPEMDVLGNGVSIADGSVVPSAASDTDFGSVLNGNANSKTFTVTNTGSDTLNLNGTPRVTISGSSAFSVAAQPASTVSISGSTTFTVQFAPDAAGLQSATVSIDNDDPDEAPYNFAIQGTALSSTDTDGDGTPDVFDTDDDNDGVSDTQEGLDGTNPLDRGSALQVLPTTFCSEWNGFLGMLNINEYYNATLSSRNLNVTMYDSNGGAQSSTSASVLPSSQFDVLVHDLPGFIRNTYGRACTDVSAASAGDIDGRTIFYHPRGARYDFAISLPYTTGQNRSQFVQFNSYDPSLSSTYPAYNWLTVVNEEATTQAGTLFYYAQDGSVLGSDAISLTGGARRDFAAHQFGFNRIGVAEWRPDSNTARFVLRNIRYYSDNSTGQNTYHSAIQLEGAPGNGEPMVLVLDKRNGTAVLELSNGTGAALSINATFRSDAGALVGTQTYNLSAYSTTHAIADEFMPTDVGSVTVDGSVAASVVATTIHYTRDAALDLKSAYAMHPRESKGSALRGSYNSYLGQSCDLILANTTGAAVTSSVTLTRNDGTVVVNALPIDTPANGVKVFSLCALDPVNSYGAVLVVPAVPNSISGTVVRNGAAGSYQFATQLRQ